VASAAAHDPVTKVTYQREVRAILQARCVSCHASGGPAPMPLTSYEEVRPWARAIKDQVLARRMPKWPAVHGYGAFANDPSLTNVEMAILAAWADGGQPRGTPGSPATGSASLGRNWIPLTIAAGATDAVAGTPGWIGGWSLEAGDPLMTSATFSAADGTAIGTWVAGDPPLQLPPGTGIRLTSPLHVRIQRRRRTDYEQPFLAKASTLRLLRRAAAPPRRVWVEELPCGMTRAGRGADVLAVRPLLPDHGSARLWLERPGAPQVIVGWFRETESLYPRTFWLARPPELVPESRIASDAACSVELTLAAR